METQSSRRDFAAVTDVLQSKFGRRLSLGRLLGEGGQGRVFAVDSVGEGELALKWYHRPTPATNHAYDEQRRGLEVLVAMDPPDTRFLWPLDLVYQDGEYGYLMKLRPKEFASIEELVLGRVAFARSGPYRVLCTAAMGIVDCFRRLHLKGLCYKDPNYGGPFFRPDNGDVLICDNDNVRPNRTKGMVFYPEFAAPEVNRGEADCTTDTDAHAIAVLLFYMLVRGNPLEGRREASTVVFEEKAKLRTFGTEPIFVYDIKDTSNRPMEGIHDAVIANWSRLPNFVQAMFMTAFGPGLRDPRKRPTDTEWLRVIAHSRDVLAACSHCRLERFVDLSLVPGTEFRCGFCRKRDVTPPRLAFKDATVLLSDGALVYPHHLGGQIDVGAAPIGAFARHESKPGLVGVKNLSNETWLLKDGDGVGKEVPPGKIAAVLNGRRIMFGGGEAIFVAAT